MASGNIFLSDAEKSSFQNDLGDLHDIWKRPLLIYRQAERVVMTENLQFIYPYGDNQPNTDTVDYVINSGIFDARIWYMPGMSANKEAQTTSNSDREFSSRGEAQLRFRNDKNYVRLKLDISAYNFIQGAKAIEVDGENFNFFTAFRRHGLFIPEYWTVWLEQNS